MTSFLHFISLKGKSLSLSPYILTSHQSKHAKITTQASYQNLGGYMASYADFDTRDGCTRRCSSECISRILPHFSRRDPAFLLPECNAVRPDFLHTIPAKHRRIIPFLDLLHRYVTGGVQLCFILDVLDLDNKADLPIPAFDDDCYSSASSPCAVWRILCFIVPCHDSFWPQQSQFIIYSRSRTAWHCGQ